jgi:hypothetical protein
VLLFLVRLLISSHWSNHIASHFIFIIIFIFIFISYSCRSAVKQQIHTRTRTHTSHTHHIHITHVRIMLHYNQASTPTASSTTPLNHALLQHAHSLVLDPLEPNPSVFRMYLSISLHRTWRAFVSQVVRWAPVLEQVRRCRWRSGILLPLVSN